MVITMIIWSEMMMDSPFFPCLTSVILPTKIEKNKMHLHRNAVILSLSLSSLIFGQGEKK